MPYYAPIPCKECEKIFTPKLRTQIFCCKKCMRAEKNRLQHEKFLVEKGKTEKVYTWHPLLQDIICYFKTMNIHLIEAQRKISLAKISEPR